MTFTYELGDGAHALDQQSELDWQRGWQVINASGGSNLVTPGTNALEVDVAAGDINAGGSTVTCTSATLDLSALVDANNPRKVVIYRDASGTAQTNAGTPESADPTGATQRDANRPAPPSMSAVDGVVLATVWLSAGASDVVSGDIRDRRLPASLNLDSLTTARGYINDVIIRTSNEKTYYIDEANGDDANSGISESEAFASWERAKEEIGYFTHSKTVVRIVGDYSSPILLENRNIQQTQGGAGLVIRGNTTTPSNHQIPGIFIGGCSGRVNLEYLQSTDIIFIRRTTSVEILNCEPRNSNGVGAQMNESIGLISNCDFGTDIVTEAIWSQISRVFSENNTGNATNYGLVASRAATIGKKDTQPTGTTGNESTLFGSVIR